MGAAFHRCWWWLVSSPAWWPSSPPSSDSAPCFQGPLARMNQKKRINSFNIWHRGATRICKGGARGAALPQTGLYSLNSFTEPALSATKPNLGNCEWHPKPCGRATSHQPHIHMTVRPAFALPFFAVVFNGFVGARVEGFLVTFSTSSLGAQNLPKLKRKNKPKIVERQAHYHRRFENVRRGSVTKGSMPPSPSHSRKLREFSRLENLGSFQGWVGLSQGARPI